MGDAVAALQETSNGGDDEDGDFQAAVRGHGRPWAGISLGCMNNSVAR